jgi:hypothetical protein
MRGKHLAWLLERIDRQRTYYLMGKMIVGKELKEVTGINLYRPADFDGKVLHLHYAREQELAPTYTWSRLRGKCMCSSGCGQETRRWRCHWMRRGRRR